MTALSDPLWRATLLRAFALALATLLASRVGLTWGALIGAAGALWLAGHVAQRSLALRRNVLELVDDQWQGAAMPRLSELADAVVSARKALAQALRKAELERDDVLAILEATSEGVLVVGHHQRIELVNDAARRLFDPCIEPLGRSLHEVTRQSELLQFAEELRRGQEPMPCRVRFGDWGPPLWLSLSGSLVRGDPLRSRAVLVLHDMTDLQHLESVRTDFVANVTHEMRSPLASILGYAETVLEVELGSQERDHVQRILRNARRLDDIIRDLIELSRLEEGGAPDVRPTRIPALLRDVSDEFSDAAAAKHLTVQVNAEELTSPLALDRALLRQALVNLVGNAIKYTPEAGQVRIEAQLEDAGRRNLKITVSDTGPGIPPEHQARIFERFYRVDTGRSRALGGTGLGLAIVKHAVARMGGSVHLESQPPRGATFEIRLPVPT